MNTEPIILVDDDEDECMLITEAYKQLDLPNKLLCFKNGKQVIEHMQNSEQRPFLIFSDIHMPLVDGLELRQHLIEDHALKCHDVPFILLTTTAAPSDIVKAYELCVQGVFRKGSSMDELRVLLAEIIGYWQKCLRS